jgi:hypothetical protein
MRNRSKRSRNGFAGLCVFKTHVHHGRKGCPVQISAIKTGHFAECELLLAFFCGNRL